MVGEDQTLLSFLRKSASRSGITGIALSDEGLSLVHAKPSSQGVSQIDSCEFLPVNGSTDVAAQLADWVAQHDARGCICVGVMEPGGYQLLQVEPPNVEPGEMREAVRWRIKDLVSFSVENAAIDLLHLPEGGTQGRTAYVVAAEGELIEQRADLILGAGLELRAIDITEMALRNIAQRMPENETGVALLWVGRTTSRIGLYRQSNLYLARSINTGWSQLAGRGDESGLSLAPDAQLLDGMVLEMQRSLDYYESHFGQNPVNTLVVLPTVEPVPSLIEHLERNMALTVRLFEPESIADWAEIPDPVVLARCITALGGALRDEHGTK